MPSTYLKVCLYKIFTVEMEEVSNNTAESLKVHLLQFLTNSSEISTFINKTKLYSRF